MVRSEVSPSRRSRSGCERAEVDDCRRRPARRPARSPGPRPRRAPPGRRRPRARAGSQLVEAGRLADLTGALGVPLALAYAVAQLLDRRARWSASRLSPWSTRSSVRSLGHLLVGRRAHGGDPADQRPGTLGPLEDQPGSPCSTASAAPGVARSRPCPTRVLCRSRLPKEDCQRVQVGQPGAHVVAGVPSVPARSASSARTSRHSSRVVTGRTTSTRTVPSRSGVLEVPSGDADPGALELEHGRVVGQPVRVQSGGEGVHAAQRASSSAPPAAISATTAAASASSSRAGLAWPRNRRAARRATTRALSRVLAAATSTPGSARTRPGRCAAVSTRRHSPPLPALVSPLEAGPPR